MRLRPTQSKTPTSTELLELASQLEFTGSYLNQQGVLTDSQLGTLRLFGRRIRRKSIAIQQQETFGCKEEVKP